MNSSLPSQTIETSRAHHGPEFSDQLRGAMDAVDRLPGLGEIPTSDPSTANHPPVTTSPANDEKPIPAPPPTSAPPPTEPSQSPPPSENPSNPPPPSTAPRPGAPLRVGRLPHATAHPHPTHDLLDRFRLAPLVATVARTDPLTGAKINKLRKSYEGQLKTFGLAGRNKAVRHDDARHGGAALLGTAAWPAEEWLVQKVGARPVAGGLGEGSRAKLERAFRLEPGAVPAGDEWEAVLGHEKPARAGPVPATAAESGKAKNPHNLSLADARARATDRANGTPTTAGTDAPDGARPSRAGKRRRYHDDSFEGYGEGFVDDDRAGAGAGGGGGGAGGGDSSDDAGSRRGSESRRKRRKVRLFVALCRKELVARGTSADDCLRIVFLPRRLARPAGSSGQLRRDGHVECRSWHRGFRRAVSRRVAYI